jgi:hypothetical protein
MKTAQEYRQQAQECRRLAELARSAEERAAILSIAASWEELARYREKDHDAVNGRREQN